MFCIFFQKTACFKVLFMRAMWKLAFVMPYITALLKYILRFDEGYFDKKVLKS